MATRALGGHAMGAARDLRGAPRFAAYAAGQAAVVAHVPEHDLGAAAYAIKAAVAARPAGEAEATRRAECQWPRDRLPPIRSSCSSIGSTWIGAYWFIARPHTCKRLVEGRGKPARKACASGRPRLGLSFKSPSPDVTDRRRGSAATDRTIRASRPADVLYR